MAQLTLHQALNQFAEATLGAPPALLEQSWGWGSYDGEGVRFAFFRTLEELRDLAATLAARRAQDGPPLTTAQHRLSAYHDAYRDLEAVCLGVDDALAARPPAPEAWPVQKVYAHILGADLGFYAVLAFALERHRAGESPRQKIQEADYDRLLGLDEPSWVALQGSPLSALQAYHGPFQARVLDDFQGLADADLALDSYYWEDESYPIHFRLGRFESHMRQHTIQIEKALAALGHEPDEIRRLLRLLYAALAAAEAAALGAPALGADARRSAANVIADRAKEVRGIRDGMEG